MSSRILADLPPPGFVADSRFAARAPRRPGEAADAFATHSAEAVDPAQDEWRRGFAEGQMAATQAGEQQRQELKARYDQLDRAFVRLGEEDADALREKLRQIVVALCETAIAPLALDQEALIRRIHRAAALLMRASDERRIHLHPDDLELVQGKIGGLLQLLPDSSMERGALRIETDSGGIEDGPDSWRRAIREALGEC